MDLVYNINNVPKPPQQLNETAEALAILKNTVSLKQTAVNLLL